MEVRLELHRSFLTAENSTDIRAPQQNTLNAAFIARTVTMAMFPPQRKEGSLYPQSPCIVLLSLKRVERGRKGGLSGCMDR